MPMTPLKSELSHPTALRGSAQQKVQNSKLTPGNFKVSNSQLVRDLREHSAARTPRGEEKTCSRTASRMASWTRHHMAQEGTGRPHNEARRSGTKHPQWHTARATMARLSETAERVWDSPWDIAEGNPMVRQQVPQGVAGMASGLEGAAWQKEVELYYGDNSLKEGKVIEVVRLGSLEQYGHLASM
ncbi:hypothetical protein NDU88_002195 [Pleurodeles waltl]|uniref:Uncharacterized protein n=1 Tax=Pleurodeles waltl TaxID=8319 RepID=A0AAV7LZU8_PLEWA|nr:hypothetical protein NDU88_002195 [Pleurodeles waltl]